MELIALSPFGPSLASRLGASRFDHGYVMTAPAAFKQSDVTRAVNGVKAAGLAVAAVRVGPKGEIEIVTGPPQDNDTDDWREGSPLYGKAA